MAPASLSTTFVCLLFAAMLSSCMDDGRGEVTIRLDLTAEQDAGRFKPEAGDRVSIAGNFNEWKPDGVFLNKASDSWEYSVGINVSGLDTLEYKFVIHSGDGRDLPNTGWENITNRRLSWSDLANHQPVHVFDTPWGPEKQGDVTFTVNLSNQVVLGYFNPENGDRVRLTGSFFDWEDGVDLSLIDTMHTYSVTLPLKYPAGVPLQYRYQILRVDSTLIDPWKGWEKTGERSRVPELVRTDFYNNQSHVLRFIVTIPDSRDVSEPIFIELEHNGKTLQTDPLMRVGPGVYETAVMLGGEGNMQWKFKNDVLETDLKSIISTPFGGIINVVKNQRTQQGPTK